MTSKRKLRKKMRQYKYALEMVEHLHVRDEITSPFYDEYMEWVRKVESIIHEDGLQHFRDKNYIDWLCDELTKARKPYTEFTLEHYQIIGRRKDERTRL